MTYQGPAADTTATVLLGVPGAVLASTTASSGDTDVRDAAELKRTAGTYLLGAAAVLAVAAAVGYTTAARCR